MSWNLHQHLGLNIFNSVFLLAEYGRDRAKCDAKAMSKQKDTKYSIDRNGS